MKIGIGIPNRVRNMRPQIIPAWAARAERAGFSSLGTVGPVAYPGVMDTVALAAAAGATSTIGLLSSLLIGPVWPPSLLAKEIAGIDAVSGGRLTLSLGTGGRPEDLVVDGLAARGLGRLEHDLEVYHEVWSDGPVGGGSHSAVPSETRKVPLLFGGVSLPEAFARMARWGEGYIGPSLPAAMAAQGFEAAGKAWKQAGREDSPRLVGTAYFALGDPVRGRGNVADFYDFGGEQFAGAFVSAVRDSPDTVRQAVAEFADLGADELIFNPTLDDLDEVSRLADLVL